MKKAIYLLSVFFCIIAISACQPTPEKEIVVHKAAEQLEATLVESDDKEADSTFICPSKLNEEIQMPHFRFVADTDIEIGQAEGFHVYEATQDRFGQTRLDEIVSYFSKDLIGARSGEMTKEDLEELSKSDWVSVEDGLPPYGEEVFVTSKMAPNNVFKNRRVECATVPKDSNGFIILWKGRMASITHWKPIEKLEE